MTPIPAPTHQQVRLDQTAAVTWIAAILLFVAIAPSLKAVSFTKVSTGPVAADSGDSRSVNFIDYDNDGNLDLFITNGPPPPGATSFLYKGNGDGTFVKIANDTIVKTKGPCDGATFGDYDNDGDLDCWVATWYGQVNQFFTNNGDGTFSRVTTGHIGTVGSYSEAGSWGDYDADGYLDLYACNSSVSLQNFLYHNNGDGTFTTITTGPQSTNGFRSRVGVWSDYNNDNNLDLFVSNEANQNNNLYKNNGDGTFAAITGVPPTNGGGESYSGAWGDIDNDGDPDILVANAADQNCFLYKNNGNGTFATVTGDPIVTSPGMGVCGVFADVDNDADLDAFITHAFGFASDVNYLFLNNGDGSFTQELTDTVVTDPGWTYGAAFGDIDHDGDLDLAVAKCLGANEKNGLYLNNGNSNNWLEVHCVGVESNRNAIGARVRVKATINGSPVWQMREVNTQSGYCSQNAMDPHFGLGDATSIDSIEVRFPSGIVRVVTPASVDQVITISECVNSDPDSDGRICVDNCPLQPTRGRKTQTPTVSGMFATTAPTSSILLRLTLTATMSGMSVKDAVSALVAMRMAI